LEEINILEDKDLANKLAIYSYISFVIFGIIFYIIMKFADAPRFFDSVLFNALFVIILLILMFAIHECIHGIFFKIFSPENKVYFGATKGMIYCAIPGGTFTPLTFTISSIAPFIIITAIFIFTLFLGWFPRGLFFFFATFHAGCCIGDFYWVWKMIKAPKHSTIETTNKGIIIR